MLDVLAIYGHYVVFRQTISPDFIYRMGDGGTFWATAILAGIVAFGAWFSLYMLKNIQNDTWNH